MRDYAKVSPQFWIGTTGKALRSAGIEAQLVALYLLTNPHANMLGLYYLPKLFISHESGLPIEGASKGLSRCIDVHFCSYDGATEIVWVHEMAAYQVGEQLAEADKRCVGIQNEYDALPENPFLQGFFSRYAGPFHMRKARASLMPGGGPSEGAIKPHRSQEQEQEQEQEKEQDQEINLSRKNATAGPAERIFAHWQSEFDHPRAQMDAKRRRLIAVALAAYDEATVCAAISGYKHSAHHMGQNERRTVYDDIGLFLRDSTHIEAGLNFGRSQAARQSWPAEFHQEVVAAYHELLPDLPPVRDWTDQRRRLLDDRIAERVKAGKNADQVSYWRAMFGQVQQSDFLRGRTDDWRCPGLEWMLDPENFLKVIEGAYASTKRLNGANHAR